MKFSSAALWVLLATPPCQAFLPTKTTRTTSSSFSTRQSPTAFVTTRSSIRRRIDLQSTTEDELEILARSIKNNVALRDGVMSPKATTHKESTSTTADDAHMSKIAAIEARASAAAYLSQYEGQSGASIVYSKLVENGVTVVNGFSGGAVLPLLDQFHESHPRHQGQMPAIRWITNSNESSAGHIAEGYGKSQPLNGPHLPVGVVVATSGPGLTNLITPLQDAICDGVPVVALCGQAATNAPKDSFQSAPAVELTRPCTKWSYQIKSAAELPMVMDYAFFVARNGRPGPVFVDLPKDLQNQVLTADQIDDFVQNHFDNDATHDDDDTAFCRLKESRRANGTIFQAVQLGTNGKALPFDIIKNNKNDQYRLAAVPIHDHEDHHDDDHRADHHPTQAIYKHELDGTIRQGTLDDTTTTTTTASSKTNEFTKEIVQLIRQSRKPIILAGQGCNNASEELHSLAQALQIPVATTLHALGCFDERHELALNMVGMHGHPTPNFMFQEADLIICVGSRFDDRITGRMGDYIPVARQAAEEGRGGVIHVDIRRSEKAKQLTPTFFVHSTGKQFLKTMNAALAKHADSKPITGAWLKRMKELQRDFPVKIPQFPTEHVPIVNEKGQEVTIARTRLSAQSVVAELNQQLLDANQMDNAIFTTGVGVHQMVAAQLITWTQPRQMLSSGSLGTMGVALGYAIGAKLANGAKIVIAVDGDGSFNMTFTELKTLAEQKIPIKIMILDNDGQMMVEYWQRLFHDNRLLAVRNSANPDYSLLAKAFGIKSLYCDAQEDLQDVMKEFLFSDSEEPVLFHVRVERTPCLPLVAPGQPLDDMILEDVEVEVDGSAAPS